MRLRVQLALLLRLHGLTGRDEGPHLHDAGQQARVFLVKLARQAAELLAVAACEPAEGDVYSACVSVEDEVEGAVIGKGTSAPLPISSDSHIIVLISRSSTFSGVTGAS